MDQCEDSEDGVPPSKTTVSGEHENQTRDQRMDNKLYKTTDYNELYQKQYPYYMPYITYNPPVGPVSAGTRPERPLATGSVPEPYVNPFEHHQRKITSSSYIDLTQSDGREEQSKDETTETHNKRMKTRLEKLLTKIKVSSYIDLTQSDCREEPPPYETTETHNKRMENKLDLMKEREDALMVQNKFMMDKFCNMADLMKAREDVMMAHMKQMENKLSSMADLMKAREDVMMAHIKLMENKLSNMVDLMQERENAQMAHMKPKPLQNEGSDSTEPEPREEPSSHSDSGRSSCESFSSDWSISRLIGFKGSRPSALKRKRLEDEGSDSTESEHEPRDEPSSHSDSDGKSSCESFKSDDSMKHPIDF